MSELDDPTDGREWLLARRNRRTGEQAYYRCHAPHPAPLSTLATVAERRWTVEESFQTAKGQTGLDQPSPPLALLVSLDNPHAPGPHLPRDHHRHRPRTTYATRTHPLTLTEIVHLFHALLGASPDQIAHILTWSTGLSLGRCFRPDTPGLARRDGHCE